MSRRCKKVEKLLSKPKDVTFEDLHSIILYFGYYVDKKKGRGGHFTYRKPKHHPITLPYQKPMKVDYVLDIIDKLNLEEWHNENC